MRAHWPKLRANYRQTIKAPLTRLWEPRFWINRNALDLALVSKTGDSEAAAMAQSEEFVWFLTIFYAEGVRQSSGAYAYAASQ